LAQRCLYVCLESNHSLAANLTLLSALTFASHTVHAQIYYIFGFLFLVMIVLVVTCAEVSILLCYFQVCARDMRLLRRFSPQ
jgi:high-affinity Fe2+/Pb2+ permease